MKYLITFTALILTTITYSQFKKVDSYTLNDGSVISKGDVVTMGDPANVSEYLFIVAKPSLAIQERIPMGASLKGGKFELIEVRELKKPVGGLKGGNAIFKIGKTKWMIELDQAYEKGEILLEP